MFVGEIKDNARIYLDDLLEGLLNDFLKKEECQAGPGLDRDDGRMDGTVSICKTAAIWKVKHNHYMPRNEMYCSLLEIIWTR